MSEITLSAGVRQNLLSLQNTAKLMSTTQDRLATGKKVNSALDNPTNFFTSQSLYARSNDLSALMDGMSNSIKTLEAADNGIKGITKLVESAQATARQALQTEDTEARSKLMGDFNDLLTQIDQLAADSGYNGKNLLAGDSLEIVFNESGDSKLDITGVDFTTAADGDLVIAAGADWDAETDGVLDDSNIETSIEALSGALATLRSQASSFGANLSVVQNRADFTASMINTLQTGADNLVLADTNEEGANMLALQTRQQLSTTALSLASQADQNVLRLF